MNLHEISLAQDECERIMELAREYHDEAMRKKRGYLIATAKPLE